MKKILVVDNDLFVLKMMEKILIKEGYEVATAEGGLAALDLLKSYTPDVMFIDLIMPSIDGKKLCKIISRMPKLNHTHRIILSAISAEEAIDIDELGVSAVLSKGPMKEITHNIRRLLNEILHK
ncbi:PleD family two-component system response regulator, partial [Thermodesulfobacteriota bacterium]